MNRDLVMAELILDEGGIQLKPYRDAVGRLTIGVGRNLTDIGISKVEGLFLFNNDVDRTDADLSFHLPWWKDLDELRQRALFNMAFNLGVSPITQGKLLQFRTTLPLLEQGRYEEAAAAMLQSLWARQVGKRALRIADWIRTGTVETHT